ncbi:MAG: hypothetical protein LBU91_09315 [Bacteroidales bacterium]|jgi:hypothetical protein|nr:hypothetical protein [Bacteroidales bacterium]
MTDFWVALSAGATVLMAIATFVTLRQNRKQLNELKKQWQEEHKANIQFSIEIVATIFFLKIENTGKSVAEIKRIQINSEFIDKMTTPYLKNLYARPLRIMPGVSKIYFLCPAGDNDLLELKSTPIKITTIFYNEIVQYDEFTINDYAYMGTSAKIENNVERALKGIEKQLNKIAGKIK